MKIVFKKCIISGLLISVFLFTIFCCCLTGQAQAKQDVPSSHQTSQDHDSSQSAQDCDCDKLPAIIKNDIIKIHASDIIAFLNFDNFVTQEIYSPIITTAYHAPPVIYHSYPLYIQHSVLRI